MEVLDPTWPHDGKTQRNALSQQNINCQRRDGERGEVGDAEESGKVMRDTTQKTQRKQTGPQLSLITGPSSIMETVPRLQSGGRAPDEF